VLETFNNSSFRIFSRFLRRKKNIFFGDETEKEYERLCKDIYIKVWVLSWSTIRWGRKLCVFYEWI